MSNNLTLSWPSLNLDTYVWLKRYKTSRSSARVVVETLTKQKKSTGACFSALETHLISHLSGQSIVSASHCCNHLYHRHRSRHNSFSILVHDLASSYYQDSCSTNSRRGGTIVENDSEIASHNSMASQSFHTPDNFNLSVLAFHARYDFYGANELSIQE